MSIEWSLIEKRELDFGEGRRNAGERSLICNLKIKDFSSLEECRSRADLHGGGGKGIPGIVMFTGSSRSVVNASKS